MASDRGIWWRIAFRNLGRHRRRTAITAAALAVGFVASVLLIGLSDGITWEMVENGTRVITGQVQVNDSEFIEDRSLYHTLGGADGVDVENLLAAAESDPLVEAAAPRVYGGGLLSSGEETIAGVLMGIDVERESRVTILLNGLRDGDLPTPGANEVLVGAEAARQLGIDVGDELVVVAPAADGSLGNDLFTVSGIFYTGLVALDRTHALLPIGDLQFLLALDSDRIHEVALRVPDVWASPDAARNLGSSVADLPGVEVRSWTEFRAELREYAVLAETFNGVIAAIVFGMAIFGVANTMLMATYERRREFAVVRALGTSPVRVAWTVVLEGLILGVMSLVLGALLAAPLMIWFHNAPPDLSSVFGDFTMQGALVRPILTVRYSVDGPVWAGSALLVTSLIAALYPAFRAVRVPPADALSGR